MTVQSATVEPELLITMFNNQILLKSLNFFTYQRRANLLQQKEDIHLNLLINTLTSKSIQLGHFYQLPLIELVALGVSLPAKENEIDSLEKIVRHSMHTEEPASRAVEWKSVHQSLKEDEALIEIIRFRKY